MNYSRIARIALKQIKKAGVKCVLRIPNNDDEYNKETAGYPGTYVKHEGFCVVTSYKAAAIDGAVIRETDKSLLCILPVEPPPAIGLIDVYDKKTGVVTGTYTVIHVEKICPDNTTVIAYKIQGRK
ncbi:MAG: hypothetical protein LBI67_00915 [Treponema sp.]|jgi:hypothetical protein|nr:hypothetical protein [Treponema sp.]